MTGAPASLSGPTAGDRRRSGASTPGWTRSGGGRAAVELWAYGDSSGDRELLADADRAVWATGALPRCRSRCREHLAGPAAHGPAAAVDQERARVRRAGCGRCAGRLAGRSGTTLLAFVAFCLAASGIYLWNDALDVEADRLHPTKRFRPVAAGVVSVRTAEVAGTVASSLSLGVAAGTGRWQTVVVVAVYVVLTLIYSVWLKHVAVLDIVAVASGFVLRAAAGAVAVDVPMSSWFVLCTVFGSLFIVTGKRYAELRELGEDAAAVRTTLAEYSVGFLRIVLTVSIGAALVSYCQWAFETSETADADLPFYELSIVPMLTALLRYALVLEQGRGAGARGGVRQRSGAAAARAGVGRRLRAGRVPG